MTRTEMAVRRANYSNAECEDVQRSIELLDRVLSEFDDVENANQVQRAVTENSDSSNTQIPSPNDKLPSLGHQSEDDGYMSMNGRKTKLNLLFKPLNEFEMLPTVDQRITNNFPPPCEEAERLISNLLTNAVSTERLDKEIETIPPPQLFQNLEEETSLFNGLLVDNESNSPKSAQGLESLDAANYYLLSPPMNHQNKMSSSMKLPLPIPQTLPTFLEEKRKIKMPSVEASMSLDLEEVSDKLSSEQADSEHFSDDSLEEELPPPPPVNKRASIAWEVSMHNDISRSISCARFTDLPRRKANSQSCTGSIPNKMQEFGGGDWNNMGCQMVPPFKNSDDFILPNEISSNANLSGTKTYIVRRGNKHRKNVLNPNTSSPTSFHASGDFDSSSSYYNNDFNTPSSRHSIDLCTSHLRDFELNPPKSRYSLDLNNSPIMNHELPSSHYNPQLSSSSPNTPQSNYEIKRGMASYNAKPLMKGTVGESYDGLLLETTAELEDIVTPVVRVVSLPSLCVENTPIKKELASAIVEKEDEEENDKYISSTSSDDISPLRKIEQNISELLERRDIELSNLIQEEKYNVKMNDLQDSLSNGNKSFYDRDYENRASSDIQKFAGHNNDVLKSQYRQFDDDNVQNYKWPTSIQKSESAKEMLISHREKNARKLLISTSVEFANIETQNFGPLPPSPVHEDDEYSEILQNAIAKPKADTLPLNTDAPFIPPHTSSNSLKTRSMDGYYNRGRRNYSSNRNDRYILPSESESRRNFYQKRSSHGSHEESILQTSCSLPDTPIFARGCDIPRTPHRRGTVLASGSSNLPRQSSTMSSINTIGNMSTCGYRRGTLSSSIEETMMGTELLRLPAGPGRGWYPKQKQRHPASIEHLDRLGLGHGTWDANKKPLTLPPNLTPKFFHRYPKDALRRVTSLLIGKGHNSGKETKKSKEVNPGSVQESVNGEERQKKKGFFKNWWKRSRHYSSEQPQQNEILKD